MPKKHLKPQRKFRWGRKESTVGGEVGLLPRMHAGVASAERSPDDELEQAEFPQSMLSFLFPQSSEVAATCHPFEGTQQRGCVLKQ